MKIFAFISGKLRGACVIGRGWWSKSQLLAPGPVFPNPTPARASGTGHRRRLSGLASSGASCSSRPVHAVPCDGQRTPPDATLTGVRASWCEVFGSMEVAQADSEGPPGPGGGSLPACTGLGPAAGSPRRRRAGPRACAGGLAGLSQHLEGRFEPALCNRPSPRVEPQKESGEQTAAHGSHGGSGGPGPALRRAQPPTRLRWRRVHSTPLAGLPPHAGRPPGYSFGAPSGSCPPLPSAAATTAPSWMGPPWGRGLPPSPAGPPGRGPSITAGVPVTVSAVTAPSRAHKVEGLLEGSGTPGEGVRSSLRSPTCDGRARSCEQAPLCEKRHCLPGPGSLRRPNRPRSPRSPNVPASQFPPS